MFFYENCHLSRRKIKGVFKRILKEYPTSGKLVTEFWQHYYSEVPLSQGGGGQLELARGDTGGGGGGGGVYIFYENYHLSRRKIKGGGVLQRILT